MKKLFPVVILLFINCKDQKQNITSDPKIEQSVMSEIKYGKKFFDYNEIDYYQIETKEDEITKLDQNQGKSKIDKLKYDLVIGETPESINDLDFLNYMDKVGYLMKKINPSNFENINKIFVEKPEEEMVVAACVPVFRDILVFKKNGKITGIAKICFSCHQYRMIGTNANTENFGSNNDYSQLGNILDKTEF
ncbi:hypothetical protein BN1195_03858 [Chryseobacterium oranimense G311]|uniref:hypothetical protein n=1 Tax=Chryseobacterium oranimense TaxID=421058 RepID=UPI0005339BA5|nr:hypothetical protein [Chryseobacterium oranimense]CEJ71509.1 hypothetical protein BN1195_03858 [Chryseobacterium oranimense G311]